MTARNNICLDDSAVDAVLSHVLTARRVYRLEKTVESLSKAFEEPSTQAEAHRPLIYTEDTRAEQEAPLVIIRDAAQENNLSHATAGFSAETTSRHYQPSIITKEILTSAEVQNLLDIFQQHYGRWIAISERGSETIAVEDINSALLLCSCCLIAVRHATEQLTSSAASALFAEARSLLGDSLLKASHSIDFFQALVILSLWPTTVGGRLLSMDPWLLTGFAFQHSTISNAFEPRLRADMTNATRNLQIWNHLCLSHLHACVSMRRKALIRKDDLAKGRQMVQSGYLSNFEVRMVAESYLYWTMYEQCVATAVNLPQAQAALKAWKDEWSSLLDQPRPQFLHMSFYFAQLLMYEQSLNNKSAAVRESLLSEMVRLSFDLLTTALETNDERTKYLTDHIYHMIAFAAVTLSRLLYKYENQFGSQHTIDKADALVTETVRWLHGIGIPSHIGTMMGNLMEAVQQKLRPAAQRSISNIPDPTQLHVEDLIIPDLLGMDSIDFDWDAMIPDWQSLNSDEFLSPVTMVGS